MGRRVLIALVLVLAVSSIGCRANEYWTFGVTRECFRDGGFSGGGSGSGEALLVALAVIVAIDILLLPVTIGHDIWLYHRTDPWEDAVFRPREQDIPVGILPRR
jgi:hypothetical protein